jgi:hypothetical protein
VAEGPHVMPGAQAFCPDLAAASFNRTYGYPTSAGGVAIAAASPQVVLVAQSALDGLATASFDVASPHYPWSVGYISIGAASPLVVFMAQAFCADLAAASVDCAYAAPTLPQAPTKQGPGPAVRAPSVPAMPAKGAWA